MGKNKKKSKNIKAQEKSVEPEDVERQMADYEVREPEKEKSAPKVAPQVTVGSSIGPSMTKSELTIPKRGGPGKQGVEGRQLEVHVNHFPMTIRGGKRVNHYDVDITTPWRRTNRKSDEPLFRAGLTHLRRVHSSVFPPVIAFDGVKNIYTTQQLAYSGPEWSAGVDVSDSEERKVKLKFRIQLVKTNIDLRVAVDGIMNGEIN